MNEVKQRARPIDILLVEDNPGDALMLREILAEGKVLNVLHTVEDGVDALQYLRGAGPYRGATRPDLILLDLNLPRMNGRECLEAIKSDPELKRIPVIVLTTSRAEADIDAAYLRHAAAYISKPVDLGDFDRVVRSIEQFWLTIVQLPPRG